MIRIVETPGISMTTIRFFQGTEPDPPYYEIYLDGDTKSINHVDPAIPPAGQVRSVWPPFTVGTEDAVRAALLADLTLAGGAIGQETDELIEAILSHWRFR